MSEIFGVKTLGKYLSFSQRKIYQLITDKKIPYCKVGGQYRFIKQDIDRWLRTGQTPNVSSDKARVYDALKRIKDTNKKKIYFIALLTSSLEKEGLKPVIVGGTALEFYTTGGYTTGDIDIVFSDNRLLDAKLSSWGFRRFGRHWINQELDLYIESPSSQLDTDESKHVVVVEIEKLKAYLIGIEDLILDRLKAYVHWKSEDDGYWAKELMLIHRGRLDVTYLKKRARLEKVDSAFTKILKEIGRRDVKAQDY